MVVLYVLKKRYFYREKKYQDVVDPIDDYEVLENQPEEDRPIINPTASPFSRMKSDKL